MEAQALLQELIANYRYHVDFAELDLTDINQQSYPDDDALIHLVARVGGPDEIALLVASGARVNAAGDMGYTPLHYAVLKGRLDVINTLLGLGADPLLRVASKSLRAGRSRQRQPHQDTQSGTDSC